MPGTVVGMADSLVSAMLDQGQLENVAWHETSEGMSAMKTIPRRTRADPFKIV